MNATDETEGEGIYLNNLTNMNIVIHKNTPQFLFLYSISRHMNSSSRDDLFDAWQRMGQSAPCADGCCLTMNGCRGGRKTDPATNEGFGDLLILPSFVSFVANKS